jgi:hypothetical protein
VDAAAETPTSIDRGAIEPYRRWASVLFTLLVVVVAIGFALSTPGAFQPGSTLGLLFLNGLVGLAVLVAVTLGLSKPTTWALHVAAPICTILVAYGLARSAIALGRNELTIPLEVIGALMVLSRPHGTDILPAATEEDRRKVSIAAVMFAASSVVSLVVPLA